MRSGDAAVGLRKEHGTEGWAPVVLRGRRRAYMRTHYARNATAYRVSAARRNFHRRNAIREIISRVKDRPCADCGVRYPGFVMDFDHRDPAAKRFSIGRDAPREADA